LLALYRRVIVLTYLVLLMPPLVWIADRIFPGAVREAAPAVPNSIGNPV